MSYIGLFFLTAIVSFFFSVLVRRYAMYAGITDVPGAERKIHTSAMPLLGGCAVITTFTVIIVALWIHPFENLLLTDTHVYPAHLLGVCIGALFLFIGGYLDDRYVLSPRQQILWPLFATACVIYSGIGMQVLSNPLGGTLSLDAHWGPIELSDILTCVWLIVCMYTTKFLDGIDGLVSGITVIGTIVIGIFSLFFFVNYPTAILSFIAAGAFAGFLIVNFHPAKMFLGEAGSTFAGYILGVLSIISGAKLAIALLILGVPILDAGWVIIRRMCIEKRSPFVGDRKHLHFRLLDSGFTQRQTVGLLYFFAILFGGMGLFLQSSQKVWALVILAVITTIIGGLLFWRHTKLSKQNRNS